MRCKRMSQTMTEFSPQRISAQSLVDIVTQRLADAIMAGELAPGARISEHALAASLGVSRGPLREAIRRLEGRKLVERTTNIGVRVASLSLQGLYDLLTVREALEGIACRLACERMSDADVDGLAALLEEHGAQDGVREGTAYVQGTRDYDFHFRIVTASGNQQLMHMLTEELYDLLQLYRFRSSTSAGRAGRALEEHRAVVAALRSRDPDRAEAAMRAHVRAARENAIAQMEAGRLGQ